MITNLELNIDNLKHISLEEKKVREENLKIFNTKGFPTKRLEEWKFTDFNKIIEDNFSELKSNQVLDLDNNIEFIKDFDHNFIILINGILKSSGFEHEDKKQINLRSYNEAEIKKTHAHNSLINLNNALHEGGYSLEVASNYKFKKPLIIYNHFLDNLKDRIINNKNLITLNKNAELNLIEFNTDVSKYNFIFNNHTHIEIGLNSILKNFTVQGCKSKGFYYKFVKCKLDKNSHYNDCILTSGLNFNKIDQDIDINGQEANCTIQSALFLDKDNHQEIKTQLNHLKPNCKSYQKIKTVLKKNSKSVYQGKIFVKNIAQKTDAYQLSKALLLDNSSEFNAKPELEIYADDVKCSHGSTSGSMNEDSIYYLMTRGISRESAIELLTKAFLFEILEKISNMEIKKFMEKKLDSQIYGY